MVVIKNRKDKNFENMCRSYSKGYNYPKIINSNKYLAYAAISYADKYQN